MKKLICLTLVLTGCGSVPTPQNSNSIAVVGGGFPIDRSGEVPVVNYSISYELLASFPPNSVAKVTFENPAGGAPFVVDIEVGLGQKELQAKSPDLTCIENSHTYSTMLEIISNGDVVDSLEQSLRFELPSAMYQAFNLTPC